MIRVGIVEDEREIRDAIQAYLNAQENIICEPAVESMELFMSTVTPETLPDIILTDIGLPGISGITGIKLIKERFPEVELLMLTIHNDADKIFQSLCAGAAGYLLKNTPFAQIKESIEVLHNGGAPMSPEIARKVIERFRAAPAATQESILTDREKEIVAGLVDGLSYKMIADRMNISLHTVRVHIKNIYKKLHIHSKAEVITKSLRGEI
jgi:DNA-binding NarL/FixJ family response regulator